MAIENGRDFIDSMRDFLKNGAKEPLIMHVVLVLADV